MSKAGTLQDARPDLGKRRGRSHSDLHPLLQPAALGEIRRFDRSAAWSLRHGRHSGHKGSFSDTVGTTTMGKTPNRRRGRNILINRRDQLIVALLIVTYLVVYTVALSAVALGPRLITLLWNSGRFDDEPGDALAAAAELTMFEERVWPLAFGLILLIGLHSIYMSHRIFGPIFRICADTQRVAAGDLSKRIRLRKGDNLVELSHAMNRMIAALDERVNQIQVGARECQARLAELHRAQFTSPSSRMQATEALLAEHARLEAQLTAFQTTGGAMAAALPASQSIECENPESDQAAQA